jgi:hypothetical protein
MDLTASIHSISTVNYSGLQRAVDPSLCDKSWLYALDHSIARYVLSLVHNNAVARR